MPRSGWQQLSSGGQWRRAAVQQWPWKASLAVRPDGASGLDASIHRQWAIRRQAFSPSLLLNLGLHDLWWQPDEAYLNGAQLTKSGQRESTLVFLNRRNSPIDLSRWPYKAQVAVQTGLVAIAASFAYAPTSARSEIEAQMFIGQSRPLQVWRWHAAQFFDRRNRFGLLAVLLLFGAATLAYAAVVYEKPEVAKLQAELERLRAGITSGYIQAPRAGEPSSSISVSSAAPSNFIAHAGALAKSAGLRSIGLSTEMAAKSTDVERVSLKALGTYAQSKAFLASLLNDGEFVATELELRAGEPGQIEIRIAIAAPATKLE